MVSLMRKAIFAGLGVSLVLGSFCVAKNVEAKSLEEVIYTEDEIHGDFSEAYNTPLARGNYLSFGYASIKKESSDEVVVYGTTQGNATCDLIGLSMVLERKVDGSYTSYKNWDFYEENVYELTKAMYVLVPKESFYRLRTYHSAKVGVTKESTSVLTKGIYIGDDY